MFPLKDGTSGLLKAIEKVCAESSQAAKEGYYMIVLSDKKADQEFVPIR